MIGRAIAQAVSRWLPTAAARVRARVWSCGICGGQSGAGVGFLRVLRFPPPIFIPPIAPQSPSSIMWGLYNRPEVATVSSGLSPTPLKKNTMARLLSETPLERCWPDFSTSHPDTLFCVMERYHRYILTSSINVTWFAFSEGLSVITVILPR
jgi:hypothetical protein